jgi:integration host factor subunit alpha
VFSGVKNRGSRLAIAGIVVRGKEPRKGRNPKMGEEMVISGRRVLTFKPSAILRKAVHKGIQFPESSEIQE